ncbi:Iron-sulfur assembly protein 1 [Coemansia sp. RSA 989]|nr:iron-sulfur cluster assembly 1-like protein, mitochondrial [Coemansia mojavensis]KAJ1741733.1 Iron-sulfur assembly protein 1 [Coemansia sp. RSA 1086]KAJ1751906.1 Iron-sulfur assembly protein 1 [Coemansia sp. RSA 1821]KAJ1866644.1 Iron-sulfur assembly protein 1 [Coemansia sp. RSA 989]KAJ1872073.1 Iron-sulfur assembly protein 1 [Coemansia sp. RSA 990]KAJ2648501.1 Iron-sulfur assembly protein 1 [Coemansia sp. RSA 1250]KAJ2670314.1 Iron-sulfur assembly protein 1 [Coemansia sp. RSA 1085]
MSSRVMVRMAPALKGRRSPLTLTQAAVKRLKELRENSSTEDKNKTLKIGIQGKGCSGNAYTLSWVEAPKKFDEKVTQDGVTVLIDSKALLTLIGTEMDWFEGKLASQFVFNNPNIKGACGCGESFLV